MLRKPVLGCCEGQEGLQIWGCDCPESPILWKVSEGASRSCYAPVVLLRTEKRIENKMRWMGSSRWRLERKEKLQRGRGTTRQDATDPSPPIQTDASNSLLSFLLGKFKASIYLRPSES
jgi:hypothetical protein